MNKATLSGLAALPLCLAIAVFGSAATAQEAISSDEDLLEQSIRLERGEADEDRQDARSQFLRGLLFVYGKSVETNYVHAIELFQNAADKGYAPAQYGLGVMFAKGRGVDRDPDRAAFWFEQAAKRGLPAAQHNFAVMLAEGDGRSRDLVRAYVLFTVAGRHLEISRRYRDRIQPLLSTKQIATAVQIVETRRAVTPSLGG